eukprot:Awhi_evm1s15402
MNGDLDDVYHTRSKDDILKGPKCRNKSAIYTGDEFAEEQAEAFAFEMEVNEARTEQMSTNTSLETVSLSEAQAEQVQHIETKVTEDMATCLGRILLVEEGDHLNTHPDETEFYGDLFSSFKEIVSNSKKNAKYARITKAIFDNLKAPEYTANIPDKPTTSTAMDDPDRIYARRESNKRTAGFEEGRRGSYNSKRTCITDNIDDYAEC